MGVHTKNQNLVFLSLIIICCLLNLRCGNEQTKVRPEPAPLTPEMLGKDDLDKINYMRLSDGMFRTSAPDRVPVTSRPDLTKTFDSIEKNENSVVIYFHGGFIPIKEAYTDPQKIKLDNIIRKGKCFPFYVLYGGGFGNVIWSAVNSKFKCEENSNGFYADTVDNSLDSAFALASKSKSLQYLMIQFNRKYGAGDIVSAAIPASKNVYQEIKDTTNLEALFRKELEQQNYKDFIREDFLNDSKSQAVFKSDLERDKTLRDLCRKEAILQSGFASEKVENGNYLNFLYDVFKIIVKTTNRFVKERNHGIRMTIFEEIILNSRNGIISGIRSAAQCVWAKSKQQVADPFKTDGTAYGGTALLDELVRVNTDRNAKGQSPIKIFLIGSSTGTIMICHLLQASSKEKYKSLKFNVIFSVPSCTMELFAQTLKKAQKQICSFQMFALRDSVEKKAANVPLLDIFYPGTILYAVSGLVETKNNPFHDAPLVGMQRFYQTTFLQNMKDRLRLTEKQNILTVMRFLEMKDGKSKKVVWSQEKSDDGNLSNNGTAHKKVIRDSAVQSSILYLLTHQ